VYKKIENCTDRTRVGAMVVGAMVDLQAWFVVQNSKNGSCDPDGGSNYRSGKSIGAGGAVPSCEAHSIGFNTVVRNAKKAAGLLIVIHCLCIALL
jgi:hypothetical protein